MLVSLLRVSTILILGVAILASVLTPNILVVVMTWTVATWITFVNEAVIRLLNQRTGA